RKEVSGTFFGDSPLASQFGKKVPDTFFRTIAEKGQGGRMTDKLKSKTRPTILPASFFDGPAEIVAKRLLGKWLVRSIGDEIVEGQINEVEAYVGPHDLACHARMGKTPRNAVMFGPAGRWYVYF